MQRKWKRRWQRAIAKMVLPPLAAGMLLLSAYSPVWANPEGGTVTSGAATIAASGATMTINQTTAKVAINWQSFGIGKGETVNFVQPSASAVALNRVVGSDPSAIYGTLTANGKVFLVNPNGILFAPGAQVNVGGLVAATLNISDSNFVNGNYVFEKNGSAGSVINQGSITAADHVVLIGPQVRNEGIIAARVSALAAGNKVSLDFTGDKLLNVTVDTGAAGGSATNSGRIYADGGLVVMSAGTKDALLSTVVNNSGMIRAQSVANVGGVIRLEGNTATNSGTLDASGKAAGQTGGTVKVLGDSVTLAAGSAIDVAGDQGGGTALVGGAWQGKGPEQSATNTTVASGTTINADALTAGNGGKVVVWANDTTNFAGTITARGGSTGGDGGSVEVSGKRTLTYKGHTDTTVARGKTGKLLLDPGEWTISNDPTGGNIMNVGDLLNQLDTADVTLATDGTGTGNITVAAGIDYAGVTERSLVLVAGNDINSNAAITGPWLNMRMTADGNININAPINTAMLRAETPGSINVNTPTITTTGDQAYNGAVTLGNNTTLRTTDSNITFDRTVNSASAATPKGLTVENGSGSVTFGDAVGEVNALAFLAVNGGNINVNTAAITTTGDQAYNGAVTLGGADPVTTLTSVDSNIRFNNTVNGGGKNLTVKSGTGQVIFGAAHDLSALAVQGTGNVTFNGAVSAASLSVSPGGMLFMNGGSVTTSGDQYYGKAMVLGTDTTLRTTDCNISFNDNLNGGGKDLTVNSGTGSVTLGGAVGAVNALAVQGTGNVTFNGAVSAASLSVSPGGMLFMNGGSVTTSGDQDYGKAMVLGMDTTLTTANSNITFGSSVNSDSAATTRGLILTNGSGAVTFNDAVGTINPLAFLAVNGSGNINVNTSTITTTGSQTYNGAVTLGGAGPVTTLTTVDSNISFNNNLSGGGKNLTVNSGTGQVTFGAANNILALAVQGTGNVTFNGAVNAASLSVSPGGTLLMNGGSVTTSGDQYYAKAMALGNNTTLFSAAGDITFNGTVNGGYGLAANSAQTTFGGLVGAVNALASLDISSGDIRVNGGSVTTTGNQTYSGPVTLGNNTVLTSLSGGISLNSSLSAGVSTLTLRAAADVTLGNQIQSTAAGDAVVLTAGGRFINNFGANAIQVSGGGRWLVYSQNPANDTRGSLAYNFKQYNTALGGAALGAGNGFIYTLAPTVTVGLTGTVAKTYDRTTAATLASGNYTTTAAIAGDSVTVNNPLNGTYDNKNAGTNKTVTVNGLAVISATDATGAAVYGYQIANPGNSVSAAVGTINPRDITVSATGQNKTYDGGTTAAITYNDNRLAGDTITFTGTATFADKNAGVGKTVTVTGITTGGADAANYSLTGTTASATANIDKRSLTASATGQNKTYDGTTNATVTFADNRVIGDSLIFSSTNTFADKNAGTDKAVNVTGITLGGADAGNYTVNATAATTANIGKAALTVTANNASRPVNTANPAFTASYGGLGTGDTAASLTGGLTFATAATTSSPAGSYAITLTGTLASPNYTVAYVNGVLTVIRQADGYAGAVGSAFQMAAGGFGGGDGPNGRWRHGGTGFGLGDGGQLFTIAGGGINLSGLGQYGQD